MTDSTKYTLLWVGIIIFVFALTVTGVVFMYRACAKLGFVKKLSKDSKIVKRLLPLTIEGAFFLIWTGVFTVVNSVIIFIHLTIFRALMDLAGLLIRKASGKEFKADLKMIAALLVTAVYLSVGYYLCHNVWAVRYDLHTDKDTGGKLRVVMLADSHLSTTFDGKGFQKHVDSINSENPDVVLIAGDFVDGYSKKTDMIDACKALGSIKAKYGVYFAYGNHDRQHYGKAEEMFTDEELQTELKRNGVRILIDETELVDNRFYIVGRDDKTNENRLSAEDVVKDLDDNKYIIVMDHQPADYDNEAKTKADLVVSGHTHGGQLFPVTHISFLITINDRFYGYEKRNGTDFVVTSGISDWNLQFKTGTKSEFVVIDIDK